jgi:uncharacterized protein YjbI with pentapeptide repeats
MDKKQLKGVLASHELWLDGDKNGKRAELQWANLRRANLQGADLRGANLRGADLRWANLQVANLQVANLQGATLQWANLQGANLCDADLREADLRKADLRRSCLRGANLQEANLREADIDLSAWPLWCGSRSVKVDRKIYLQLLAHLCAVDVDDAECKAHQQTNLSLARQSHIANELGLESEE